MNLPPERITVKRRYDEEPVDALYIEAKRNRPSALWKRADQDDGEPQYTETLPLLRPLENARLLSSAIPEAKALTTRTATPLEHPTGRTEFALLLQQNVQPNQHEPPQTGADSSASPITRSLRQNGRGQDLKRPSTKPRNFHLSKNTPPKVSPHAVSKPRAHMQTKPRRKRLAIFTEDPEKVIQSQHANTNRLVDFSASGRKYIDSGHSATGSVSPRKRPGVTPEERKRRATDWDKLVEPKTYAGPAAPSIRVDPFKNWDVESPELAEQLQQVALDEIRAEKQRATQGKDHSLSKSQPKPPKPRQLKTQSSIDNGKDDVDMIDSNKLEGDHVYVFDTYVRSTAQPIGTVESSECYGHPLQGISQGSIGILVIDEDEEKIWETYGEVQESDPEWNSEEEDENAEDYYGNDYPEDEVNTDDEHGRGAYNYRHDASDDEEFGVETASWSDVEEEAHTPWSTY